MSNNEQPNLKSAESVFSKIARTLPSVLDVFTVAPIAVTIAELILSQGLGNDTKTETMLAELSVGLTDTNKLEFRKLYLISKLRRTRLTITLAAVITGVIIVTVLIFVFSRLQDPNLSDMERSDLPYIILVPLSVGTLFIIWKSGAVTEYRNELELIEAKLRISEKLPPTSSNDPSNQTSSYFDSLVKINIDNLAEYYSLVKVHTNHSFHSAIGAGVIGFAFIIFGLSRDTNTQIVAFISTAAGIITNFIAGIFFYLYNRTVLQLKEYHDSLLYVQNILLSFKMLDGVKDDTKKGEILGEMIYFLMVKEIKPLTKETQPNQTSEIPPASG